MTNLQLHYAIGFGDPEQILPCDNVYTSYQLRIKSFGMYQRASYDECDRAFSAICEVDHGSDIQAASQMVPQEPYNTEVCG
jgi:hypothetical protein